MTWMLVSAYSVIPLRPVVIRRNLKPHQWAEKNSHAHLFVLNMYIWSPSDGSIHICDKWRMVLDSITCNSACRLLQMLSRALSSCQILSTSQETNSLLWYFLFCVPFLLAILQHYDYPLDTVHITFIIDEHKLKLWAIYMWMDCVMSKKYGLPYPFS